MNSKLEQLVRQKLQERRNSRTFKIEYEGETLWVKTPEMGEANGWHLLLAFFAKLLNNNFLIPTVVRDPKASLAYEAQKIMKLSAHQIAVPELVLADEEFLVLKDAGKVLSSLLNNEELPFEEKRLICEKLSQELANMHNRGFYHSRPALRDIACKEGKITFMDFEENLEETLSDEEAIIRDGLIYVHALYRKLTSIELTAIALESYHRTLRPDLWEALLNEARRYRFTYALLSWFKKYLGKDGYAVYKTLAYFRSF